MSFPIFSKIFYFWIEKDQYKPIEKTILVSSVLNCFYMYFVKTHPVRVLFRLIRSKWAYCILRKMRTLRIRCYIYAVLNCFYMYFVKTHPVHVLFRLMRSKWTYCVLRKMRKICARLYLFLQCAIYAQDYTYFPNAQYMRKICARLYLFPQCVTYAQDCTYSPMCTIYAQVCTYFSNMQYMHKICARLYFSPQCAIFAQDCRHYWEKYVTYHISALNLELYSLHCYFWIATSSDFFLNKHL